VVSRVRKTRAHIESSREQMPGSTPDAAIWRCWSAVITFTTLKGTWHSLAARSTRLSSAVRAVRAVPARAVPPTRRDVGPPGREAARMPAARPAGQYPAPGASERWSPSSVPYRRRDSDPASSPPGRRYYPAQLNPVVVLTITALLKELGITEPDTLPAPTREWIGRGAAVLHVVDGRRILGPSASRTPCASKRDRPSPHCRRERQRSP
jgi:hypothetical protein